MPTSIASSDDERDELMEDADDGNQDVEVDLNDEEDNGMDLDDEEDGIDDDDDEDQPLQLRAQMLRPDISHSNSEDNISGPNDKAISNPDGSSRIESQPKEEYREKLLACLNPIVRNEAVAAGSYDIIPTMAAPHATSINAITASPDFRYWFTGGSDGYIRKFDGPATVNGRSQLTVAQRHPFVESVVKAGVTMTYWENLEKRARLGSDEPEVSVVYSLAAARDSLWLLSGQQAGTIRMQTIRHNCGEAIHFFEKHTSAVSVLTLSQDEKSLLSGSWDKSVIDWDLSTGQPRRTFVAPGQMSAIQIRPESSLSVPEESGDISVASETMSDNNAEKVAFNHAAIRTDTRNDVAGVSELDKITPTEEADSLFGDAEKDSLFGDDDETAPSAGNFGTEEDEDEFSKAVNAQIEAQDTTDTTDMQLDASLVGTPGSIKTDAPLVIEAGDTVPSEVSQISEVDREVRPTSEGSESSPKPEQATIAEAKPIQVEVPEVAVVESDKPQGETSEADIHAPSGRSMSQDPTATSGSTFLAASHEGTLMIWDRRQQKPIARIPSRTGGPWCMDACWSPDGNSFYAGRRNNTVEEYSVHKGFKEPNRILKFPAGSGPVTAVKAMPNGRHLICASYDILRLYDLKNPAAGLPAAITKGMGIPFTIVPGPPRPGVISALYIDPQCRYMLSTAGNRGWEGMSTESMVGFEIACLP